MVAFVGLVARTTSRWLRAGCTTQSAAIAFYALISMAPILVVAVSVAGFLLGVEGVETRIIFYVESVVGPESASLVRDLLAQRPAAASSWWSTVGAVALFLFGSTAVFVQLEEAIRRIWDDGAQAGGVGVSAQLRTRLVSFCLVLATGGVLVLSAIARGVVLFLSDRLVSLVPVPRAVFASADIVVFTIAFVPLAMLIFRVLPSSKIPWRDAAWGALTSGVLLLLGQLAIGAYLGLAAPGSVYGAAGSVVVLLFWIFYSAGIFLWGAALTRTRAEDRAARAAHAPNGGPAGGAPAAVGAAVLAAFLLSAPDLAAQAAPIRYTVEGLEGPLRENVMTVLGGARFQRRELVEEGRVRRLHQLAVPRIQAALEPFGHYEATVDARLELLNGVWEAMYRIDAGPPVRVSRVDLRVTGPGAEAPRLRRLLEPPPLVTGEPLRHAAYEALKRGLVDAALETGYLDAAFDSSLIRVDRAARDAEVIVHFRTGPRFEFGPVTFHQEVLDPRLLQGLVPFREGDPFDNRALLELQGAVSRGPWFESALVRPRRDRAEGLRVPVDVELTPRKSQRFLVGVGYGTDTGPRVTFDFELRRLARSGHRMTGQVQWSLREGRVSTQYEIPWPYPRTEVLSLSAGFARLTPTTSQSEIFLVGAALARSRGRWREAVSLTFQPESWTLGDVSGTTRLLLAGLAWSRTWADDRLFPSRGKRFRFEVRGSLEDVLSDVSIFQAEARGWWIQRLAPRTRLLLRAEVAGLVTPDFSRVPASLRYFAGGDQSIRGYAFRSLGPRDEAGNPLGGQLLATGGAEVEQMLLERWGIAAFIDLGNAVTDLPLRAETGVGAGLRWRSPIGLVRLDGAFATSRDGMPFRVHLRIGPDL